jgi:hypothetical protein
MDQCRPRGRQLNRATLIYAGRCLKVIDKFRAFGTNRNLKVCRVRVTTDRCSNADQNVRCVRTVFGGGWIDGASRDSTTRLSAGSTGRFVLRGYPICNPPHARSLQTFEAKADHRGAKAMPPLLNHVVVDSFVRNGPRRQCSRQEIPRNGHFGTVSEMKTSHT